MKMDYNNIILVLPSWYPSKLNSFDGDFVKRHIQAISLYCKQYVIFVIKDEEGVITSDVKIEASTVNNIKEVIIYYKPFSVGIKSIDKILSHYKYVSLYKKAIRQFIKEKGVPSVTHLHVVYKAGVIANWVKRKWNVPFITTEHWTGYHKNAAPNIYTNNKLRYSITKVVLQNTSLLAPVTKQLGEVIVENFNRKDIAVVPNVVDTTKFFYNESTSPPFTFCHISTMGFQKNVEGIIKACTILKNKEIDFVFNFIGAKPERLLNLAKHNDLLNKHVFFYDEVAYEAVAKYLQQSHTLVLFSWFENLPCVILESLCCGTPVISTAVGGINEVINDSNGVLINQDENDLALAMEKMITNYQQYNRKQIAEHAQQKFNYETIGKQYFNIYNTIASK
jgi:glycosyltransferase involved in cell wall biosynthesis